MVLPSNAPAAQAKNKLPIKLFVFLIISPFVIDQFVPDLAMFQISSAFLHFIKNKIRKQNIKHYNIV